MSPWRRQPCVSSHVLALPTAGAQPSARGGERSSATLLRQPSNQRADEAASSTFALGSSGAALPHFRSFARRLNCRQQQRRKDADNRNHHQQLDESERRPSAPEIQIRVHAVHNYFSSVVVENRKLHKHTSS